MIRDYLAGEGFQADLAQDGDQAIDLVTQGQYALVVLDVMMPGLSGIEVLKGIRALSSIPVLMLTARGDETDRVVGLELGADDYVPKPCSSRELVARIRAILRRSQASPPMEPPSLETPLQRAGLTLWSGQRKAELEGAALDLTSTEFNLLEVLMRNAGRVVNKEELSLQGLGRPLARYDRSIDVHMANIRRKLNQTGVERELIKTVIRRGYQLLIE
jgi:DNA-binding response OmpR family regulator